VRVNSGGGGRQKGVAEKKTGKGGTWVLGCRKKGGVENGSTGGGVKKETKLG